ncbi:hypothetical protein [Actinomadura sp. 9N215]|uniref:hypothetical protein n=1 Tax=Actinomadura sp. 9N215 TaxID=3375150 RepID=UPI003795FBF8
MVFAAAYLRDMIVDMDGYSVTWKRTAADSIVPVGNGVYFAPVKGASLAARAAALSGLLPQEVVVARRAAAWIWGLDVLPPGVDEADWNVELIDPGSCEDPATPITAECVELPADHVTEELDARDDSRSHGFGLRPLAPSI